MAALDHPAQCSALADEVLLTYEFVERSRSHPRGEWRVSGRARQVERLLRGGRWCGSCSCGTVQIIPRSTD